MASWSVLTSRKLVPGAYDESRAAWRPEKMPKGVKAYILREVGDPDEVVAFGFFDGTRDELEALRPDPSVEEAHEARMAPHVASQFADGVYEVVGGVEGQLGASSTSIRSVFSATTFRPSLTSNVTR